MPTARCSFGFDVFDERLQFCDLGIAKFAVGKELGDEWDDAALGDILDQFSEMTFTRIVRGQARLVFGWPGSGSLYITLVDEAIQAGLDRRVPDGSFLGEFGMGTGNGEWAFFPEKPHQLEFTLGEFVREWFFGHEFTVYYRSSKVNPKNNRVYFFVQLWADSLS